MESLLGDDFGDVRIHAEPAAGETARELEADAFTVERDVFMATGKGTADTAQSMALLGHELTHARQSREASHGERASSILRREAEEREAVSSERAIRRVLDHQDDPDLRWRRPEMALADLGVGARKDLASRQPTEGGGQVSRSPGTTPGTVAPAAAGRSTEPDQASTGPATTRSDADSSEEQRESIDLNALAREVYDLIMRRLTLERERAGRW